ncbi:MAG: alginate export family protein [Vicinamibacterales bacterium]
MSRRSPVAAVLVALVMLAAAPRPVPAQTAVHAEARDVVRVEAWSFFDPPPGAGDPDYRFTGHRVSLAVRAGGPRWQGEGEFQYAQLFSLPPRAIGPGGLGTGAYYYYSAGNTFAYQVYARRMNVRFSVPGLAVTAGRMGYESGLEVESGVAAIERTKRRRLAGRLLSGYDWSIVQRAFDGARVDVDRGRWRITGAALLPTQGTYEESATPTIERIVVGALALTRRAAPSGAAVETQIFAQAYRDTRAVTSRPDNSGRRATAADVGVVSAGASAVGRLVTRAGEADWLAWGAAQGGRWYGQPHRAWSVALEGGHRWSAAAGRPRIGAGWLRASGDADPLDGRHGTFFQPLPDTRRYSATTAWAQMNVNEVFVEASIAPARRLRVEAAMRRVGLASGADRWYSGSGATARNGGFFGYTTRPAFGATHLGTVVEGQADLRLTRWWSVNGYLGWMKGGPVVRRSFAGDRLLFGYVENVLHF